MVRLETGSLIPYLSLPKIAQAQLGAYAQASGDHNPIHLDEKVAREMGLPGVIAHGMLSAAFLGERALRQVSESSSHSGFRIKRFQSRFKSMVFLGDEISVGGMIKEATPQRLVLELQARNQKNEPVTTATVEFMPA